MNDVFRTIEKSAEGNYTEKKSKFLSYIFHIETAEEVKVILDDFRKKYYDARHHCWAYMLGPERDEFRSNDDGEPSGTAGRPILGQINSAELTDVLLLVIRYYGGTPLGTSGLIRAYKTAAAEAIGNAQILEKTVNKTLHVYFEYPLLNDVMRVLKQHETISIKQDFKENCHLILEVRKSLYEQIVNSLSAIYGVLVKE